MQRRGRGRANERADPLRQWRLLWPPDWPVGAGHCGRRELSRRRRCSRRRTAVSSAAGTVGAAVAAAATARLLLTNGGRRVAGSWRRSDCLTVNPKWLCGGSASERQRWPVQKRNERRAVTAEATATVMVAVRRRLRPVPVQVAAGGDERQATNHLRQSSPDQRHDARCHDAVPTRFSRLHCRPVALCDSLRSPVFTAHC